MDQTFEHLAKILTLKPEEIGRYKCEYEGQPQQHLEKFMVAFMAKQTIDSQTQVYSRFINYMSDQKHVKLMPQFFSELTDVKVVAYAQGKAVTFDAESRAYCLYGQAVSALKRKTKQVETERPYLCSQLENTIFQLYQDGNLHLSKNESHDIEDILLNFETVEDNLDPILLSNQVFSPFIPRTKVIILILPIPLPRPDHIFNFLKNTLLHIYTEQANTLSKIAYRQLFYKNSQLKGIYFIQQGEVESTGGRIVARGWVTNGTCKSEGYGWKFKVLPFMKSIAKNEHIWKQFVNDLTLNKEYPFKLSYLLGTHEDLEVYQAPDKRGRRGVKLPRIANHSFDYGKLTEIERMKHYDDRISQICDYKQKMIFKKSGSILNRKAERIVGSYDQKAQKRMLIRNQSKQKQMLRYPSNNLSSSSENILIMSVLRKLESLTEPKTYFQDDFRQRKDKIKISPAKLYEKSRVMKKKRYNQ